jgi:hypothetical protein
MATPQASSSSVKGGGTSLGKAPSSMLQTIVEKPREDYAPRGALTQIIKECVLPGQALV